MKPEDLYDAVDGLTSREGWVADKQTKGRMLERPSRRNRNKPSITSPSFPPGGSLMETIEECGEVVTKVLEGFQRSGDNFRVIADEIGKLAGVVEDAHKE